MEMTVSQSTTVILLTMEAATPTPPASMLDQDRVTVRVNLDTKETDEIVKL